MLGLARGVPGGVYHAVYRSLELVPSRALWQTAEESGSGSMTTAAAGTVALSPTALVQTAVEALSTQFFEPLVVADLLQDAWEGAVAALARAGVSGVPAAPAYPTDPGAAYAVHAATFPVLEQQVVGRLAAGDLAEAALEGLLARRRDGHTFLHARRKTSSPPRKADPSSPAGWSARSFGMVLTDTQPLTVADVVPRGPAQCAGVRRGQIVVAINGQPAAHRRRYQAEALLDHAEGTANALTLRSPGGRTVEVELRPDVLPMPVTDVLPGPFGLLRMDGFTFSATETQALRAALTSFEQAGARGWIIDMRWNRGGGSAHITRLLIDRGRLFSRQRHDEARLPDGTLLPLRVDIDADGTAVPFQRPLVVLIGPGSISGAESLAGPLQAYGRATLVGERTAGLCGAGRSVALAPGWGMTLAAHHTVFGPQVWRLNRIGVTPDLLVKPTPEDEAAGHDPQLAAALEILRR